MMGSRQLAQGALFYEFSLEDHVPPDHLLRGIARFVDLGDIRKLDILPPCRSSPKIVGHPAHAAVAA
jgi:hypothetical protein